MNTTTVCTYSEAVSWYTEVFQPDEPVGDGGKIHEQTGEDLQRKTFAGEKLNCFLSCKVWVSCKR